MKSAGLLLAFSEPQVLAEFERFRVFDEVGGADKKSFELGQLSFAKRWVGAIQKLADEKSEDGVPQKLQLFVISISGCGLVGMRAMGQRLRQQLLILELVLKRRLESFTTGHK